MNLCAQKPDLNYWYPMMVKQKYVSNKQNADWVSQRHGIPILYNVCCLDTRGNDAETPGNTKIERSQTFQSSSMEQNISQGTKF